LDRAGGRSWAEAATGASVRSATRSDSSPTQWARAHPYTFSQRVLGHILFLAVIVHISIFRGNSGTLRPCVDTLVRGVVGSPPEQRREAGEVAARDRTSGEPKTTGPAINRP
jgi:hypothetical protein